MLDHVLEKAREEEIFSREDTPTEQRVLAGFMYHAGLSFRRIEPFVDVSHVVVHDWYHRLEHLSYENPAAEINHVFDIKCSDEFNSSVSHSKTTGQQPTTTDEDADRRGTRVAELWLGGGANTVVAVSVLTRFPPVGRMVRFASACRRSRPASCEPLPRLQSDIPTLKAYLARGIPQIDEPNIWNYLCP